MKNLIFRVSVGIAAIYHLILGLSGLLLPTDTFVAVADFFLGYNPEIDEQFQLVTRFISAYLLVFGATLTILAKNPQKYRALLIPVLLLFGIRLLNKIIFFGSIGESLGISSSRNIFGTVCIFVLFASILATSPNIYKK